MVEKIHDCDAARPYSDPPEGGHNEASEAEGARAIINNASRRRSGAGRTRAGDFGFIGHTRDPNRLPAFDESRRSARCVRLHLECTLHPRDSIQNEWDNGPSLGDDARMITD